jgi:Kdo2-lipid IVA lauroyltransferase/acyltransferase
MTFRTVSARSVSAKGMEHFLYLLARLLVAFVQALPLAWAARLGRTGGALVYRLDARHRRVAVANLQMCFAHEKSSKEIRSLARENFRRIGENYACAIKTAAMSAEELRPHVEFVLPANLRSLAQEPTPPNLVIAIGHFGNFELYARFGQFVPGYQCVTTYRGLPQPLLNELLQSLRARSGCIFFERRFEAAALKATMNQGGIMLGLLADQHAGLNGLRLPFLGHDCSTSPAPAVFALRYHCALYTGVCYRVGLARWRVEAGHQIPTCENGRARATSDIMNDVNRAFEAAVRIDPANWFWVHKRWKGQSLKSKGQSPEARARSQEPVPQSSVTEH